MGGRLHRQTACCYCGDSVKTKVSRVSWTSISWNKHIVINFQCPVHVPVQVGTNTQTYRETRGDRLIIAPCKDATEPTKSKCRLHHSRRTVAVRVDSATQSHALAAHSRSDGERSPDQERLLPTPSSVTRLCFRPTDETYPETYRYLCVYFQASESDQPTNYRQPTMLHRSPPMARC